MPIGPFYVVIVSDSYALSGKLAVSTRLRGVWTFKVYVGGVHVLQRCFEVSDSGAPRLSVGSFAGFSVGVSAVVILGCNSHSEGLQVVHVRKRAMEVACLKLSCARTKEVKEGLRNTKV